jgi:hypothetical protein
MKARLVSVEGLPGSGKTSAAEMVYAILKEEGIDAELWYENSMDHPADFDGTAYLEEVVFQNLMNASPGLDLLSPVTAPYLDGYLVSYRKAIDKHHLTLKPGLLDVLVRNDVYERDPDLHMRIIQERWKDFVRDHEDDAKVFIFECVFLQNPVTALKVKHDAPDEETTAYIESLLRIVSPLKPILLYMDPGDTRTAFLQAVRERPALWYEGFERYYTEQGYGLAHGFSGTDGVLRVLEERVRVERNVLRTVPCACHLVDNSAFDPASLRDTLRKILIREGLLKFSSEQEKER